MGRSPVACGVVLGSMALCALVPGAVLPGVLGPARAAAQPREPSGPNPLVSLGQEQYDELHFEQALQTLSAALVRAGNTDDERATIYRLLAFTYHALGRDEEAAGAYRGLLAILPGFSPGNEVAPRIREFLARVRRQWESDGRPGLPPPAPVQLRHRSPAQVGPGERIPLEARLEDPGRRVERVVLAFRHGTEDVFRRVDAVPRAQGYHAAIPSASVSPPLVEYYFEGLDRAGLPVVSRGDVAAPLRVAVPEPNESVFGQWWFWTGAVVVVAGAVTTALLLTAGSDQEQGTFIITVR